VEALPARTVFSVVTMPVTIHLKPTPDIVVGVHLVQKDGVVVLVNVIIPQILIVVEAPFVQ
jgi:hypothetical protein